MLDRITDIISHDIDIEFIKSVAISLAWEYADCFEGLNDNSWYSDGLRTEEFGRRRGGLAQKVLIGAARQHGIPFNVLRLDCNGQEKVLLKIGRLVLVQEPMLTHLDQPRASDYKRELANTHGLIQQLELDLRDQPARIKDWSGCVLAVLLHAPAGPRFSLEHKKLGALMLGVADEKYQSWMLRLDLHRIAMFGFAPVVGIETTDSEPIQQDRVVVTPKRKDVAVGGEE